VANNNREIVDRFSVVAQQFCSIVDSAPGLDRTELLLEIYRILPSLIHEAVGLPEVELSEKHDELAPKLRSLKVRQEQHTQLYNTLKERLGDWDLYRQVFEPTKDQEAIFGTLADDFADIYRDLKKGLILVETPQAPPGDSIWIWRVLFYSHWGQHAIGALGTIHDRLSGTIFL